MRILVLEDEDDKFADFEKVFLGYGIRKEAIVRIKSLHEFLMQKGDLVRYDLCLIDFFLPLRNDESDPEDCTKDIYKVLDNSSLNTIPVLAITRQIGTPDFDEKAAISRGIIAYHYDHQNVWKIAIGSFLTKAKSRHTFDFIGIFALEEERKAYIALPNLEVLKITSHCGIDTLEVNYNGYIGGLFCLSRMGLVDASISTARIMENYSPRVAFMSGICGGFSNALMGQILITDFCWEYQSGKWLDDGFQNDSYQEAIGAGLKAKIKLLVAQNSNIVNEFEEITRPKSRPSDLSAPKVAIFSSGSSVIASAEIMKSISRQHRKVSGIDMELFGFHRAMNSQNEPIPHFSCKVVVDKADKEKNDQLHEYGCTMSALMCLRIIDEVCMPEW